METHRGVVVAKNGVVAASQPLSVGAGLGILQRGGSFIDAAIAVSACQAVTEPYSSHLGGDAFVIVYDASSRKTTAFNASGAAPRAAKLADFAKGIPLRGPRAATVPGLVDCWFALHSRFGKLPFADVLAPAIAYARDGFPAGYRYSRTLTSVLQANHESWVVPTVRALIGLDRPPHGGAVVRQPDLAWTLDRIAEGGRDAFYKGPVTDRMLEASRKARGLLAAEDFSEHSTQVGNPLGVDYRGYSVHGQPPVSQGHILLQELNIVEGFDMKAMGWGSADAQHVMVEAKKLAFADRAAYLGDPRFVEVPLDTLLSKEYAARQRARIDMKHAAHGVSAGDVHHDTTYFCVADRDGNGVSFIQSVFHLLGSGFLAEGTGVLFNNRMNGFSLDPRSPNILAPGKRPAHTLNAYIVTRGGGLAMIGGTPGADTQVQSNLQVICNVLDFGMNPQEAIESPRWDHGGSIGDDGVLYMEDRFPESVRKDLEGRGHRVRAIGPWAHGSNVQFVRVDPESGAYHAGSDPRSDGQAAGF